MLSLSFIQIIRRVATIDVLERTAMISCSPFEKGKVHVVTAVTILMHPEYLCFRRLINRKTQRQERMLMEVKDKNFIFSAFSTSLQGNTIFAAGRYSRDLLNHVR